MVSASFVSPSALYFLVLLATELHAQLKLEGVFLRENTLCNNYIQKRRVFSRANLFLGDYVLASLQKSGEHLAGMQLFAHVQLPVYMGNLETWKLL